MSFIFPRIALAPVRCGPTRHEIAPLFSLFDDTFAELQRATRVSRRQFNPRFDLKETKEAYSLEGELPGIDQKDLNIEFTDEHTLTIKGRSERHTGSGSKSQAVEAEKQAAVEDTPAASDASSVKSHQATVEDEELVNSSAAAEKSSEVAVPAPTEQPAQPQQQSPEQQYWISERHVGHFSRSFSFPQRVNQEQVKASLKNGILSIVVPKAPAPESRRINIE
jgi:HSP20 family protein